MVINGNKKSQKIPTKYTCILCDYVSYHKNDFNKHNLTLKHKMINPSDKKSQKIPKNNDKFICSCGKEYKFSSGLSRHTKICDHQSNDYMFKILQDNKDFKELMIEQNKQIIALSEKNMNQTPVQNITNNNTQNNVTFNLNYFLNTTCKDALNMKDFIASIHVTLSDLENTGKNGFVKSMTRVITRELGKLEVSMRPIHCSDIKRKVLHIKDENAWHKDTETCANAKLMVRKICHETNVMQIPKWVTANPRSQMNDDKLSDLYFKIVGNSMDGSDETYEKIITGVSGKIHVGDIKPQILLLN